MAIFQRTIKGLKERVYSSNPPESPIVVTSLEPLPEENAECEWKPEKQEHSSGSSKKKSVLRAQIRDISIISPYHIIVGRTLNF
jgi:hypothetical protein